MSRLIDGSDDEIQRNQMQEKIEELTGCVTFLPKLLVVRRGSGCGELAVDIFPLDDRGATRHETLLHVSTLWYQYVGASTDLPCVSNE